ncbi:hypothetical protein PB2503_11044 [Parvularcula bermudensis HTCC2503]|uniref:Peptidase M20 dimerisation domain-containing protein n=1 Tax=Parvularcula bermudensis (strain ATCC BAA-594 / HTCC2503 / KCTC 12087) TaxID=314260 RepID=E0THW3_PARBH|nr:hydrolase [Parvularcula bermudensis]ADM10256.1 hypothetical protein PB2503_11044 [Parvularcula bermudensis HTCC2503]
MTEVDLLTAEERDLLAQLDDRGEAMLATTIDWARHNTGSTNVDGLERFAPILADVFSALEGEVRLDAGDPFHLIGANGEPEATETGPILRVSARTDAPVRVVFTGHYDTVFPPGTFTEITDLGGGVYNGPGLADMKGGLVLMREALLAFEASPLRDRLGYEIVITPDEEIGNFASANALIAAAQSGVHLGMTYEPALEGGALAAARKGSAVIDIVVRGRAVHAGRAKAEGRSALEAAAWLTCELEALNARYDGVTVNVGAIEGGAPVNIVPDLAILRVGCRAPDGAAAAWCQGEIDRLVHTVNQRDGISAHLHGGFYRPPKPRNAAQDALIEAVDRTGRALGLSLSFIDSGGVCEGNNLFAAGVPNIDTLGVRGGRIHSHEEFVEADSFVERARLSALLLARLASGEIDGPRLRQLMTA